MNSQDVYNELKDFRKDMNDKFNPICKLVTEHEVKIKNVEKENKKINGRFKLLFTSIFGSSGILGLLIAFFKFRG